MHLYIYVYLYTRYEYVYIYTYPYGIYGVASPQVVSSRGLFFGAVEKNHEKIHEVLKTKQTRPSHNTHLETRRNGFGRCMCFFNNVLFMQSWGSILHFNTFRGVATGCT